MKSAFLIIFLLIATNEAIAGELTGLGGIVQSWNSEINDSSYSWQLEYREELTERYAASFSFLNEGHVPGHHRDGMALQLWTKSDLIDKRLTLSGGIGPYYFFNTTTSADNGFYSNDHDPGVLLSLSALWRTESPWILHLRTNWIKTVGSIDSVSALAGIGYQLEPSPRFPKQTGYPADPLVKAKKNEITLFAGITITNSFDSEHSTALGVEYRRALMQYLDVSVAWLYEGDSRLIRRDGLISQLWAVKAFQNDTISLGFGAGAYFAIDQHAGSNRNGDRIVSGIAGLTGAYHPSPHWSLRASWNRIITNYDRDTDVIMGGIGYRF